MVDASDSARNVQRLLSEAASALERLEQAGVGAEEVLRVVQRRQDVEGVPVSIFNPRLGALESIVKYMREELLLDYGSIARLLGRNEGPVGVTYRRARVKMSGRLDIGGGEAIPFDVLSDEKLSVLESIAYYLAKQGHDWHEIAQMMCRHDKTIWTVLDRAKRKLRESGIKGAGR
jgi:hypothetical protein